MKGPSCCESIEAVPRRTNRPEADDTGLAVLAVLGVDNMALMVPGLPAEDPGLDTPLMGLPKILTIFGVQLLHNLLSHLKLECNQ